MWARNELLKVIDAYQHNMDALLTLIDYCRRIIDGVAHIWVGGGVGRGRRRGFIDAYRLLSTHYRRLSIIIDELSTQHRRCGAQWARWRRGLGGSAARNVLGGGAAGSGFGGVSGAAAVRGGRVGRVASHAVGGELP